jgi:ferredoxin
MTATETGTLRYVLDADVCAGHGRCYALAPESFESDDVGYGRTLDVVHPADRRTAMEAVAMACPEEAITVEPVEN